MNAWPTSTSSHSSQLYTPRKLSSIQKRTESAQKILLRPHNFWNSDDQIPPLKKAWHHSYLVRERERTKLSSRYTQQSEAVGTWKEENNNTEVLYLDSETYYCEFVAALAIKECVTCFGLSRHAIDLSKESVIAGFGCIGWMVSSILYVDSGWPESIHRSRRWIMKLTLFF